MASSSSSSSKAPCATCGNKSAGIFRCEGCLQVFCRKHLNEHRDLLNHQLDQIVLEHDTLQQTIADNKHNQNIQLPILKQIDKWEKDSILKIQQLAEDTRQQVNKLIDSQTAPEELRDLAERLQKARTDDDYVEADLRVWATTLQKLRDNVHSFAPSITIEEDSTQVLIAKMHLVRSKHRVRQSERFGESFGEIHIAENGLVAVHRNSEYSNVYVRGVGEYSSGTHKIRFLLTQSSLQYVTSFDVVSKLMLISERTTESAYKSYGWRSDEIMICVDERIKIDRNFRRMQDETIFEIELELDCDKRRISYVDQRTKNRNEMNVDIMKCPFPWQIQFNLFDVGDCVRLLA